MKSSSPRSLFSKVLEVARSDGWGEVVAKVARRVKISIYTTNAATWYERDLTRDLPELPKSDVRIRDDKFERLVLWLRSGHKSYMFVEEEVACAREHGHTFFWAERNGTILGYLKVAYSVAYIADFRRRIVLPAGVAMECDMFVSEASRGMGIAKSLHINAIHSAKQRGYVALRCHIPDWNVVSRAAVARCGFHAIRRARFHRVLGLGFVQAQGFKL